MTVHMVPLGHTNKAVCGQAAVSNRLGLHGKYSVAVSMFYWAHNGCFSVPMDGLARLRPPIPYIATESVILVEFRKKCLKIQQYYS